MLTKCENQAVKVFAYGSIFVLTFMIVFGCVFYLSIEKKNSIELTSVKEESIKQLVNQKLDLIINKLNKIENSLK